MEMKDLGRELERNKCLAALAALGYTSSGREPLFEALSQALTNLPPKPAPICNFAQPTDGKPAVREVQLEGSHIWTPCCQDHLEVVDATFPGARTRKLQ